MGLRISDDPLLPHLILPRFKLGLDQAQYLTGGFEKCLNNRQNNLKRNKADIDYREVQRFTQLLRGNIAHIGAFHHNHTRIGTDFPVQLSIAHIDSKNLAGTLL